MRSERTRLFAGARAGVSCWLLIFPFLLNPNVVRTQVRKHGGHHGGQTWFMPAFNYFVKPLPGVELEVVNLDLNHVDSWKICVS